MSIPTGDLLVLEPRHALTHRPLFSASEYAEVFDVVPDGRFLMVRRSDERASGDLVMVQHFFEELKTKVP